MDFDAANIVIGVVSIAISCLLSYVAYRASSRQNQLTASTIASDWVRDLRTWASEAVDVLAEATYVCHKGDPKPSTSEVECFLKCRHRLSALIDRGRFLLPNERDTEYGDHKPRAYRGLRHHALDALVAAENILGEDIPLLTFRDKKEALIALRREFVSSIHAIIDPQSSNKKIAEMLQLANSERSSDPTVGGLLPDGIKVPTGALGVLETASRRNLAAASDESR